MDVKWFQLVGPVLMQSDRMQTEVQETKSLVTTQLSQDLNEQQFNPTIDSQDQMVLNTGVV